MSSLLSQWHGDAPLCCLLSHLLLVLLLLLLQVALQPGTDKVLGCIDIRLPQTATGMRVLGGASARQQQQQHCQYACAPVGPAKVQQLGLAAWHRAAAACMHIVKYEAWRVQGASTAQIQTSASACVT
jgi:hypothetical protein